MKKKIIIATIVVGAVLAIGIGMIFMGNGVDKNSPQVIQEGKKLAKAKDVETYVDNAFKMYKKHGPMSNDVWKGYDLKEKNIIVGERDNKTDKVVKAWLLTQTDKKELTKDEMKGINFPSAGGYSPIKFENKEGIVMSINKGLIPMLSFMNFNYIYDVAVHEMYHFYGDNMEKYDEVVKDGANNNERYTAFPKEVMPRVYRKMIYDNLVLAYENPTDEKIYLGKAKYWNEKWGKEYLDEYKQANITDIAEGKARYIEYLMCIDYKGISDKEKIESIKYLFNKETEVFEGSDDESYELGFVSGVLLDKSNPNWKKEIDENPQRPVEMILKDVKAVKDDSDHYDKVLKKANSQINKSNKKIENKIKNIKDAENDKNIPLLQLNNKLMNGSYTTSDFIEYEGKVVIVDFGATFKNDNGSAKIDGVSSYVLKEQEGIYNLPLTMKYKFENNRLIIDQKGVKVDAKVKETKNSDGRTVYIME
ncbi:MAG: hypothetical protein RSG52_11880 [Terrisporobacter sp.]|uniref:hypothetical protein n=1 Tax=Terrisporobacter sp. TaxID=1965305 RepID=UPI002FC89F7E